jgi:hypothetical protein
VVAVVVVKRGLLGKGKRKRTRTRWNRRMGRRVSRPRELDKTKEALVTRLVG